tara:strand:+ start:19980 stop:20225 length:246 start_codon:yes stop_codon:yes gene_type:complete
MDRKNPAPFVFARFLVRAAVVMTIGLIGWDVLRRVGNPRPKPAPIRPDDEMVQLKGRVAELELEVERLRIENADLKRNTPD